MAKTIPLPTFDRLHELLNIVPIAESQFGKHSGLTWKINRNKQKAGNVAGTLQLESKSEKRLDWRVRIDGKKYLVSRIIYFMVNGVDPGNIEVDHQDRNPLNNNISNLSLKSRSMQVHNRGTLANNTSGAVGVIWHKQAKKWQAKLRHNKKSYSLGLYNCKTEAACAYNKKVLQFNLDKIGKPLNNLEAIDCCCGVCVHPRPWPL